MQCESPWPAASASGAVQLSCLGAAGNAMIASSSIFVANKIYE
jgi:hypothetical protein